MGYRTIYIDMVFLVNFMMDLLLLSLLKGILRKDSKKIRLCAGALAGALWACGAVLTVAPGWAKLAGSLAAAMAMTAIAFQERNIKAIFFMSFLLLCLSFYLSGLTELIYNHTGAGCYMQEENVPSCILFPLISAGSAAVWKGGRLFWEYQGTERQVCRAALTHQGKTIVLRGFVDTGNRLYDPYQGRPVHIVQEESLKELLLQEQKFLYVPYHSVGKPDGLLKSFTAEELQIVCSGKLLRQKRPLIALSPDMLNRQDRYQMILHPDPFFMP